MGAIGGMSETNAKMSVFVNIYRCVSAPKTYVSITHRSKALAQKRREVINSDLEYVKTVEVKL